MNDAGYCSLGCNTAIAVITEKLDWTIEFLSADAYQLEMRVLQDTRD